MKYPKALPPFAEREEKYRIWVTEYIKKTYPLIEELFGEKGVQKVVEGELDITRNIYNNLHNSVGKMILDNKHILLKCLEQQVPLHDEILNTISKTPNDEKHYEIQRLSNFLGDNGIRAAVHKGDIKDPIQVQALLKSRKAFRSCPFKKAIGGLIVEMFT